MRAVVRAVLVLCCSIGVPSLVFAQATIAGAVRDSSGAVLPGVTVEATSPALIEKVRTAVTDGTGRYRIENLRPGDYTVTFTLPGFSTVKREGLIVSGSAVIAVDAEMRVGGVQETITVTGETPVVDVQSTKREITLDNETMRNLPGVRSYSYLLTTVPGLQTNINNVNTGPVFAIFPIHGGRGVESRLTVDGLNISNPPGGNQPPNFTADIGNAQEVTMTTSGGLGEIGDRRPHHEHRPEAGRQQPLGPGVRLRLLEGDAGGQLHRRAAGARRDAADAGLSRLRRQHRRRRSDRQGQALVLHERPPAGSAAEHAERLLQPERGQPERLDLRARSQPAGVFGSDVGELHAAHHVAGDARNKFTCSWDEQPVCRKCTGTTSLTGSPNFIFPTSPEADGHGEFSPQRVQTVRWTSPVTNRLLLEAGFGTTYYQWGGKELDPNPTENLVQVLNFAQADHAGGS